MAVALGKITPKVLMHRNKDAEQSGKPPSPVEAQPTSTSAAQNIDPHSLAQKLFGSKPSEQPAVGLAADVQPDGIRGEQESEKSHGHAEQFDENKRGIGDVGEQYSRSAADGQRGPEEPAIQPGSGHTPGKHRVFVPAARFSRARVSGNIPQDRDGTEAAEDGDGPEDGPPVEIGEQQAAQERGNDGADAADNHHHRIKSGGLSFHRTNHELRPWRPPRRRSRPGP